MATESSQLFSDLGSKPYHTPQAGPHAVDSLLDRGIAAFKASKTKVARRFLALAVQQNPDSERAWFWLSATLRTPQGRAYCLRQVLAINPENQMALRGLDVLENEPLAPVLLAHSPPMPRPYPIPAHRRMTQQIGSRFGIGRPATTANTLTRVARYALGRALLLALTVVVGVFLAVVFINFGGFIDDIFREGIEWSLMMMSRDMTDVTVEEKNRIIEEARWQMEEAAGLHEPFLWRCALWTKHGLTLNWDDVPFMPSWGGASQRPMEVILERLPNSLLLAGASNLLLFFLGIAVALTLARKHGHWLDRVLIALSPISSAPNWVFGVILTVIFAAQLHLLPLGGKYDAMPPKTELGYVWVVLKHMILPVTAIFLSTFFQSAYAWRTYFLLHAKEDYVEMAEAQGLPRRTIERRHILRPALPYVLTSFALLVIGFWQGAMALEVFFNWPGIGSYFIESVWRLERTSVISLVVIFAYLLAITVFILDIAYALVDPRVKMGQGQLTARPASGKAKRPLRLFRRRRDVRLANRSLAASRDARPVDVDTVRPSLGERLRRRLGTLKPALRELRRYPSAIAGLIIILLLVLVSIYTVIAIPYQEAIEIWRMSDGSFYYNPKYAQPQWVNFFRKNDLPRTIILSSQDETVQKSATVVTEEMTQITTLFVVDYAYERFPQDMAVHLTAEYEDKKPFVSMVLLTPDGREIELESFSMTSAHTYLASADTRLRHKTALRGEGGQPMEKLFAAADTAAPGALQGTYVLQINAFVFGEGDDVDAELVLYGQVHGLAGTDHQRRDLTVALLWGMPVALAFGLLGAVCTSLATMVIAGVGVWFGGWPDHLVQRLSEINMILPALPIAITVYLIYAKSVWVILGVMVLLSIFGSSLKNYRAMFLQVKEAPYIEAARAYGASNWRIIRHYLLPRITPVLIPQLVIMIPGYVFLEATLAFLGVSDVYLPTWGKVINDALTHNAFQGHYYWVLQPIGLLMLTGLAFAMVGIALDSIFNPRLREM